MVLLSIAKGPSLASPIAVNPPPPLNTTFGIPQVIGSPGFWFGMPMSETTSKAAGAQSPERVEETRIAETGFVDEVGVRVRVLDPVYCS